MNSWIMRFALGAKCGSLGESGEAAERVEDEVRDLPHPRKRGDMEMAAPAVSQEFSSRAIPN